MKDTSGEELPANSLGHPNLPRSRPLLRQPAFRFLWAGSVASSIGSSAGFLAIVWLVFGETRSAFDVALLGLAGLVPRVLFGIVAGALADRFNRIRLMMAADGLRAATMIGLASSLILVGFSFPVILLAVIVVALGQTIFRPAINSFLPTIVRAEELGRANGLVTSAQEITAIVGSPLGGFLIASVGVATTLALNGASYAVSGLLLFAMAFALITGGGAAPGPLANRPAFRTQVREGFAYLKGQAALLKLTLASFGANFFLALFYSFLVVYVSEVLGGSALTLGILAGASGLGFAVGSLSVGRLRSERRFGFWFSAGWGIAGVTLLGVILLPDLIAAAIFLFIAGVGGGFGNTTFFTGVQKFVPNELLGRYLSIDEVGSLAAGPAGTLVGGLLIVMAGIRIDYTLASAGTAIFSFGLLLFPDVRALRTES